MNKIFLVGLTLITLVSTGPASAEHAMNEREQAAAEAAKTTHGMEAPHCTEWRSATGQVYMICVETAWKTPKTVDG